MKTLVVQFLPGSHFKVLGMNDFRFKWNFQIGSALLYLQPCILRFKCYPGTQARLEKDPANNRERVDLLVHEQGKPNQGFGVIPSGTPWKDASRSDSGTVCSRLLIEWRQKFSKSQIRTSKSQLGFDWCLFFFLIHLESQHGGILVACKSSRYSGNLDIGNSRAFAGWINPSTEAWKLKRQTFGIFSARLGGIRLSGS